MKSKHFICIGAFLLAALSDQAGALAAEFGIQASYWVPSVQNTLRVDRNGIVGSTINLKEDLDFKSDDIPFVEAYVSQGNHELTFMYAYINGTGAKTISRDIVFNGEVYQANAYVESRLKTHILDLEYQYKLLNFKNVLAGLSIGLLARVKYIGGEAGLFSATAGSSHDIKESINLPIPMFGASAKMGILANILEARIKGAGMAYSGSYFYDVMADLAVTPVPFMDIHGGYRIMSLKIDDVNHIFADATFSGFYGGIGIRF